MPVDQTGENILFVLEDGQVEAHVQIQYSGDPDRFAWLIPIPAEPEISVGSQPLFDALLAATVPTLQLQGGIEACSQGISCVADLDCGVCDWSEPEEEEADMPEVVGRGFAGAFAYDVLEGGSVAGVTDWLDEAGYAQDPEAAPILAEYLDAGYLLVAVKLRGGAGVSDVHPLVIRYAGSEPCIPIRLTRIAAQPDMAIRAFFLGEGRMYPRNYAHVVPNLVRLDWASVGTGDPGYEELISLAVDEAGGRAFVTEYAGRSDVVDRTGIFDPEWTSEVLVDATPAEAGDELVAQGLIQPDAMPQPQLEMLLRAYLPPPAGMDPVEFWSCIECHLDQVDEDAWNGPEFAAGLDERVLEPGAHADGLLNDHPHLTRLLTRISPEEMTQDPTFIQNADGPGVTNVLSAYQLRPCREPDRFIDPNDFAWAVDTGGKRPTVPAALRIEQAAANGAPQALVDNTQTIQRALDEFNAEFAVVDRGEFAGCRAAEGSPTRRAGLLVLAAVLLVRRRRAKVA